MPKNSNNALPMQLAKLCASRFSTDASHELQESLVADENVNSTLKSIARIECCELKIHSHNSIVPHEIDDVGDDEDNKHTDTHFSNFWAKIKQICQVEKNQIEARK